LIAIKVNGYHIHIKWTAHRKRHIMCQIFIFFTNIKYNR